MVRSGTPSQPARIVERRYETPPTLLRARSATREAHLYVEDCLDLLAADLDGARMGAVLVRLFGFWSAVEATLLDWARSDPAGAARLGVQGRCRAEVFARDALAWSVSPAVLASAGRPVVAPVRGAGEAWGVLYVLEGSALGGRVIAAHLDRVAPDRPALRSMDPYGMTGRRQWRAFCADLEAWVLDGGDPEAVCRGAVSTFAALAAWCAPLHRAAA